MGQRGQNCKTKTKGKKIKMLNQKQKAKNLKEQKWDKMLNQKQKAKI